MKNILKLLLVLSIAATSAFADIDPYTYHFQAVKSDGNGYDDFLFGTTQSTTPSIFVHDPDLQGPVQAELGAGLSYSSGTLGLTAMSVNNTPSRTIQTVAAAANGWQISSTRNASVQYSTTISTTATIGGASSGYVVLEVASTNSSTAGDWQEIARSTNAQTISLALILQSVQTVGGQLMGIVPAGKWVRLRAANVSGTPTYTFNSGQEVQL